MNGPEIGRKASDGGLKIGFRKTKDVRGTRAHGILHADIVGHCLRAWKFMAFRIISTMRPPHQRLRAPSQNHTEPKI